MNKTVKCPACNEAYNLDLDKYGGKKIKCKKCHAVISVPTTVQAEDEFEVVEESSSSVTGSRMPPSPQIPPNAIPSILQRNRMASQRGAVNIALLQRNEGSREEIREAFLEVHGSKEARLPNSIVAMIAEETQLDKIIETDHPIAMIECFRKIVAGASAAAANNDYFDLGSSGEEAYVSAVKIVGNPVDVGNEQPKGGFEGALESFFGSVESRKKKRRKIATIKAALEVTENMRKMLLSEKTDLNEEMQRVTKEHSKQCRAMMNQAAIQIQAGSLSEATMLLHDLQKNAPIEILGSVLTLLSQCTYLSGNASNAARHIQDAICFGASAPVNMDEGYNDLWAKASSGLPRS